MKPSKLLKSLICVIMAVLMLVTAVACNNDASTPANTTAAQGETTKSPSSGGTDLGDEADEEALYKPAEKDFDRDFKILTNGNGSAGDMNLYMAEAQDYTGNVINDALFRRQLYMEEIYGVSVLVEVDSAAYDRLSVQLNAGTFVCDLSLINAVNTFALAQMGLLVDLAQLESLNLEASYWDQRIQSEYAIGDRLYMLEGDFTINDELRTYVVLYNDTLYDKYGYYDEYGSPYDMVKDETWTLDKMLAMSKDMYLDNNNNQVRDEQDTYGIVGELTLCYYAFLGSGLKTIANNNGQMTLLIKDNTFYSMIYDTLEDTMQMALNDDILMPQLLTDSSDIWGAASSVFENNRALFRTTSLSAALRLTNMESLFGILPIPAYTEEQGGYYCWVSGNNHCPAAIPKSVPNAAENAEILEIFCYSSRYMEDSLYVSFYEVFRLAKLCRTPEDVEMLELVFNSKTFDFDQTTKITGIESALYSLAKSRDLTSLSSTISGLRSSAQANLNSFLLKMVS